MATRPKLYGVGPSEEQKKIRRVQDRVVAAQMAGLKGQDVFDYANGDATDPYKFKSKEPQPVVKEEPKAEKPVVEEPVMEEPEEVASDDLTMIKGVGAGTANKLNEMGVTTFAEIAAWTEEDVAKYDKKLHAFGRIERGDWVGKAKALVE